MYVILVYTLLATRALKQPLTPAVQLLNNTVHTCIHNKSYSAQSYTRRPASADRTARAANFSRAGLIGDLGL